MKLKSFLLAGAAALASTTTHAQTATPAPVRETVDANGVDLFRGALVVKETLLSLGGDGNEALTYQRITRGPVTTTTIDTFLTKSGSQVIVQVAGYADRFNQSGATFTNTEGNGATLSLSGSVYTYTARDGTVATFSKYPSNESILSTYNAGNEGYVTAIVQPGGEQLAFTYDRFFYCEEYGGGGDLCVSRKWLRRLASVSNASGYILSLSYADSTPEFDVFAYLTRSGVKAVNRAVEACAGSDCPTTTAWPSTGSVPGNSSPVPADGYAMSGDGVTAITHPGDSTPALTVSYSGGKVYQVTGANGTTSYAYADSAGARTVTASNGLAQATAYVFDLASERLTSVTDPLARTTSYQYDGSGRVTRITRPEGNYTQFSYDARGNVTQTRAVARPGWALADIVTSASYPASCTVAATCNQPTSTTDPRGHTTSYTYASHGGLLTATGPAPTAGAPAPQVRYSYGAYQARIQTASGLAGTGQSVTLPTAVSQCRTTASCAGTADELVQTIAYPGSATPHNLQPASVTLAAGDGSLSLTTGLGYDAVGNRVSVDGPAAGAADTVRTRYDLRRQVVGIVSPDPDGAGSGNPPLAVRTGHDAAGRPIRVETGTVADPSDAAWAGFAAATARDYGYDAADRPVREALSAGGTVYAVSERSYDAAGRPECVAQRMNPAAWATATAACTAQAAGAHGPDRITRTGYTAAGERGSVTDGWGVSGTQATVASFSYEGNGGLASVTDAEGNRTGYAYDGFDRLYRTYYPAPTKGAGTSSTTDYAEFGYDPAGNLAGRRGRDGRTITWGYDALDRPLVKVVPDGGGLAAAATRDVHYGYDLQGRLLYARFENQPGEAVGFGHDGLGRTISETSVLGGVSRTLGHILNAHGARTRLTYPDGGYASYNRDGLDRVFFADNGVLPLYYPAYDAQGRVPGLYRWVGSWAAASGTGFDGIGRPTSLAHALTGGGGVTSTFGYNPAGQIVSQARDNDGYAFPGHANTVRGYTANGLNQYIAVGGTSPTHDAAGNLSSDGTTSYTYDVENRLVASSAGAALSYDPLGRLWETALNGAGQRRFVYDGDALVAEYDGSGVMTDRYVHGDGTDQPLVWYQGAGMSTPRYLYADERGSIVAVADAAGTALALNRYDEYGAPAAGNLGRFQYTGQLWLPELGMYHYKARIYDPRGGRFLQTDPIGYYGDMNLYGYAGGDPINGTDPSGLRTQADGSDCVKGIDRVTGVDCGEVVIQGIAAQVLGNPAALGRGGRGGGGGLGTGQGLPESSTCQRSYSPIDMAGATNIAIATTGQRGNISPLSSEFSKLDSLPNLSSSTGWRSAYTPHATGGGFEHDLPGGSGMVVKVYIGDTHNGGANTVTITSPTWSVTHVMEQFNYYGGDNINEQHAKKFMKGIGGC